jgi:hypothetical protein
MHRSAPSCRGWRGHGAKFDALWSVELIRETAEEQVDDTGKCAGLTECLR